MSEVKNFDAFSQSVSIFLSNLESSENSRKLDRVIGSNGLNIGQEYNITGLDVLDVKDNQGNQVSQYLAFILSDGSSVSVASAVPPTSFNGFVFKGGKVTHTTEHQKGQQANTIELVPTAEMDKAKNLWNCPSRTLRGLIEYFANSENYKKYIGATLVFHGIAYKQTTAKRNGAFSNESWEAGDPRAIGAKLYSITPKN